MLALHVSPIANLYLPNELTEKEQKSLVSKEEISCNVSEVVSMLSRLKLPITN